MKRALSLPSWRGAWGCRSPNLSLVLLNMKDKLNAEMLDRAFKAIGRKPVIAA